MEFMAEKDEGTIPFVLSQILDTCINGITLSDPDQPDDSIVYANEAFELITGYDHEEIVGHNCRFLQGTDRDQPEIERTREALRGQKAVTVTLRNYRKDGTLFYNRFSIRPLLDRQGPAGLLSGDSVRRDGQGRGRSGTAPAQRQAPSHGRAGGPVGAAQPEHALHKPLVGIRRPGVGQLRREARSLPRRCAFIPARSCCPAWRIHP